jgi:hypothetical protein
MKSIGLLLLLPLAQGHTFTYSHGAMPAGHGLQKGNHTLSEAQSICAGLKGCHGFTYHLMDQNLTSTAEMYFKSSFQVNFDSTWSTYLMDAPPSPKYHIVTDNSANDVNAIFEYEGVGHMFHQGGGGWRHYTSPDFVRWKSQPTIIQAGGWDGSLNLLEREDGTVSPVILYDCTSVANCRPKGGTDSATTGLGDPPIVGVARPKDPKNVSLVKPPFTIHLLPTYPPFTSPPTTHSNHHPSQPPSIQPSLTPLLPSDRVGQGCCKPDRH